MILFGIVPECLHRSPFSVVAALVPLAHQMDEASKFSGASSKSNPLGKRVLALAAVRLEKSSLLILAQEKTQFDVKGQEMRPIAFLQVSSTRDLSRMVQQSDVTSCISQVPPEIQNFKRDPQSESSSAGRNERQKSSA